ncbi:MAG: diadenylate cyclase CdaA [Erysipelotrichaceae bacterium]|nr:diadenylate cyclase CdaA [Erysipelotrichaceae bacterium]
MSLSLILTIVRYAIDIVAVWIVIYYILRMLNQNVRTMQLIKGVLFIIIVKFVTQALKLTTLSGIADTVLTWGVLAIIIIFQPEIRNLLEKMGQTRLEIEFDTTTDELEKSLDELVTAITTLARTQTGALVTFERTQSLADHIHTGVEYDAEINSELLQTIFYEGTPLHDGATIIKHGRIVASACFYPPTSKDLSAKYGARHRAAIGISEITDSLTIIVSEETGTISFAEKGELTKINRNELRAQLINRLNWFNNNEEVEPHE